MPNITTNHAITYTNNSLLHKLIIGRTRPRFEGPSKCLMFYFCSGLAEQAIQFPKSAIHFNQSIKMKHLIFPRVKNGIVSHKERAKRPAIPVRHVELPWVAWSFVSSICSLAEPWIEILSSHVAQQKQDGYFNRLKYSQATTAFIIKHIS